MGDNKSSNKSGTCPFWSNIEIMIISIMFLIVALIITVADCIIPYYSSCRISDNAVISSSIDTLNPISVLQQDSVSNN